METQGRYMYMASYVWFAVGLGNCVSPVQRQAISSTKVDSLSVECPGTYFNKLVFEFHTFSLQNVFESVVCKIRIYVHFFVYRRSWKYHVPALNACTSLLSHQYISSTKGSLWVIYIINIPILYILFCRYIVPLIPFHITELGPHWFR